MGNFFCYLVCKYRTQGHTLTQILTQEFLKVELLHMFNIQKFERP